MKEIEVTTAQEEINGLLDCAREEDLLLQASDGTEFLLTVVDDFDEEIARTRANKELMALLDERRKETGRISLEDVERKLGLV
jgi:hypothetical protein